MRTTPVNAAVPLLILAMPSDVVPLKKFTDPVAEEGVTVAVSVTGWPVTAGLGFAASATELCAAVIVTFIAGEILTANIESPKYCPVILWAPGCKDDVVKAADPFTRGAEPIASPPSTKCTLAVTLAGEPFMTDKTPVKVSGLPEGTLVPLAVRFKAVLTLGFCNAT